MSGSSLTPKEQAEQEDKKLLAENGKKIQEVMQLIGDGDTRTTAKTKLNEARTRTKVGGKGKMVFHPYNGKRTPVSQEASDFLALGNALELSILTSQHNNDLQNALTRLARERVDILERVLNRG
jgi:hypothetical protein